MSWINIAILVFDLGAFLLAFGGITVGESPLAFGGDRWSNNDASLFGKITLRGWISLICIFIAIGLVIKKEAIQHETVLEETTSKMELAEDNVRLQQRIANHVKNIVDLKTQINKTTNDLSKFTDQIESQHLSSLEAAFKLSYKSLRETDDAVVNLDGRTNIPIPSRYQEQMRLYGGDRFYFATFVQDFLVNKIDSIQLEVGGKPRPLFNHPKPGFLERTLLIPGNSLKPKPAVILNPLQLTNITLKIFIRPVDPFQREAIFRDLILSSPFSEFAKQIYKTTTADMLNLRLAPSPSGQLVSRLKRGSFVRKIQEQSGWIEVMTPEGKKGWVTSQFLSEIE